MTQLLYIMLGKLGASINFTMENSHANLFDDDLYLYLYENIKDLEWVIDTKQLDTVQL